jgi:hypothetical protein
MVGAKRFAASLVLVTSFVCGVQVQAQTPIPRLFLEYSQGIDLFCRTRDDYPAWVNQVVRQLPTYQAEMFQRLPWFQQQWSGFAPQALGAMIKETGVPFQRREYSVALYLCPTTTSMGTPLQINVLYHLQSPLKDIPNLKQPHPPYLFLAMVFHELGHKYVEQVQPPPRSKLIQTKYRKEENMTKVHLHLFALQKRVWLKMGWGEQLPFIQKRDAFFGAAYKRAWQIVDSDGEEPFIQELRNR